MLERIGEFLLSRSANRACTAVQHTAAQMIARGENPALGRNGVSVAVGIDQINGTVWGMRPTDAVDIFTGRLIRREWRADPRLTAIVHHA